MVEKYRTGENCAHFEQELANEGYTVAIEIDKEKTLNEKKISFQARNV